MKSFFSKNIGHLRKHEIELDKYKAEKKGIGKIKALIKADEDLMSKVGNEILDRFKYNEMFKRHQGNLTHHISQDDVKF